jgi:hypothetical protein
MGSGCNDGLDSFVKIPTIKFTKLFINGEFIDSISGFHFSLFLVKLLYTFRFFSLRYDSHFSGYIT